METQRLILRPWHDEDAAALYKYASNPAVGPIAGWPPHTSVDNSREIIRTVLSGPETYAMVLKETGEPIGSIGIMYGDGLHSAQMGEGEAEIGYWLGVPYWGKGLTPEAVRRILRRCFDELGLRAVWCGHYEGNTRSRRVMEKCGFVFHHTETGKPSPLGDIRTEHFLRLTAGKWHESIQIAEEPFDINRWLASFRKRLTQLFGDRLRFLGLQGSYGRGEATTESDIDVVVILDHAGFDDLRAYRRMLDSDSRSSQICGFVAGEDELMGWERSDLLQLYLDTRPVIGSLECLHSLFTDADIRRAVRIGACNLYHACSHNFLHARSSDALAALYKAARFTVRMKHFMKTGYYVASMSELDKAATPADKRILDHGRHAGSMTDGDAFDLMSRDLLEWSSALIEETKEQHT